MRVESLLEQSARRTPDKTALVADGRRWTYREANRRADRLAHALRDAGVLKGDRVAVCLDNSAEAVFAVFGILKAGAVFLLINPSTKAEKMAYLLNHARAKALLTDRRKQPRFSAVWGTTPSLAVVYVLGAGARWEEAGKRFCPLDDIFENGDDRPVSGDGADLDLAALLYTSGTTGPAKGVMLTHLNLASATTSITAYLENTDRDVVLTCLPLSFGYGLSQVLTMFMVGGTVVLERSFMFPYAVLETLRAEGVTGFPLVPTMAAMLLQLDLSSLSLPSLRYLTNAAAPLPLEHIKRLRAAFPGAKLFSMYGQTECIRVSYLAPDQLDARPSSVGRGMPNQDVWIEDESGRPVGPGVTGELMVRGPHVMKGYWDSPEETDKKLKPGPEAGPKVLRTGDLFRMDVGGYLYFVSRQDDIIKCQGEKVSPLEVEEALCAHPQVAEAAVIGIPDAVLGQSVRAVVSARNGHPLSPAELLAHCKKHLEDFMVPKSIVFARDGLPKSANGKVDKRSLVSYFEVSQR